MTFAYWCLIVGGLLVFMALAGSVLKRLPLSGSMLYLAVGFALGPNGLGMIRLDPLAHSSFLEHLAEVAVLISLFTAGLKLRVPLSDRRWWLPVRLAFVSMALTVGLIAVVGVWGLGLSWGAAILLGAILAPTDPVLASDVQVTDAGDRDRLRFSLTGEAGMNDGTAFPFVMLGLGLLGVHELGANGWRWFAVDLVWAVAAGFGIGALLGTLLGRLVIFLRREYREGVGLDDFLALGLIALSYGLALVLHAYGFLAVFAAGVALRRVEMRYTGPKPLPDVTGAGLAGGQAEVSVDAKKAPAYMAQAVLGFNEQVERIGEVALVVVLGGLLATVPLMPEAFWFVPLLLLVIRPAASLAGMGWSDTSHLQRGLIAWFGIRGIGSIYYLMFAISHGLDAVLARQLTGLTLAVLVASIVVHGVSVTPLMDWYARKRGVPKSETGPFKKPQSDAKGGRRGRQSTAG